MLTRTLRQGLTFLIPLALSADGSARKDPPPDETLTSELMQLLNTPVTSASLVAQKTMEAPSIIGVITREQIQAYGWTHLNALLYRQPGFAPSMDFNHRTVSSRGMFESFANNHLLHLVDGVPMNDPLYGTAWTWEMAPNLFMAKSVEILRGPGSALYGSNATFGVVHVKTLRAEDIGGAEAQIRMGQAGEAQLEFLTGVSGAGFSAVLGGATLQTDGNPYPSIDGSLRANPDASLARFTTWDKHPAQYLWAKVEGPGGMVFQYHFLHFNWEFGQGNIMLTNNHKENLDESRHLLSLSGQGAVSPHVSYTYLLRYQKRPYAWFTQEFPDDITVGGVHYPNGLWENVDTEVQDWFGRTQWSFQLPESSNLLVGLEADRFLYRGDRAHYSNVDLTSPNPVALWPPPAPFPDNAFRDVGPFMEWIKDQPVTNVAAYAQFTSGDLLGQSFKATLGLRTDRTTFDYRDIDPTGTNTQVSGGPLGRKVYSAFSPRIALVYVPSPTLSFKLMGGRAFRAPAPIEFGVAHSYYTASNIKQLEPEVITTMEMAMDWVLSRHFNWRVNVFDTRFDKLIGYDSLSVYRNLYRLDTRGLETELLFSAGRLSGFLNYSYAKRYGERIMDPGIALAEGETTWYPTHGVNFGLTYRSAPWVASLSGRHQGRVARRASEVGAQFVPYFYDDRLDLDRYRPRSLDPWFVLDARLERSLGGGLFLALQASNVLDTSKNLLIKTFPFPFDFRAEPRRVSVVLRARFK